MYKIKYYYQTGDSFSNEDAEDVLELEWFDYKVAEANVRRIQEHYDQYQELGSIFTKKNHKEILEKNMDKDWFVLGSLETSKECLKLYTDEGKVWQIHAPWIGYFEHLHEIEIIFEGLKISF